MKIAIIGAGISGLGAAYMLKPKFDIVVYEKNDYVGGHSRTIEVKSPEGMVSVDTGFIVFNHKNYPLLSSLFASLDVPVAKSRMSFGVSFNDGVLEYGTKNLASIFAQKTNMLRPAFWSMVRDLLRFNKEARSYLERDSDITLGRCLEELKMGNWFRDFYLIPMGGSIWSTPAKSMYDFPANTFIRFFENHGLLDVVQPQWYTVVGGSKEYVKRLIPTFFDNIRLNCAVKGVVRHSDRIEVIDTLGNREFYDRVIFACHSDQALSLLHNPSPLEQEIIGCFRYQSNDIVVHSDTRFMPRRRQAWASWVSLLRDDKDSERVISMSYWMNNLQPIETNIPILVTLNPSFEPDPALTYDRYQFEHPLFDSQAIGAQEKLVAMQGKDRIWYCGAWQRYGFHEDGLLSAVNVVKDFDIDVPWR